MNQNQLKNFKNTCNMCGKIFDAEQKKMSEWMHMEVSWGYFSKKDGEVHEITLCESCYDSWTKQFLVPIRIREQVELL